MMQTKREEFSDTKSTPLFSSNDAKKLATSRRKSKVKELFSRFKEVNQSKSRGEDKNGQGK